MSAAAKEPTAAAADYAGAHEIDTALAEIARTMNRALDDTGMHRLERSILNDLFNEVHRLRNRIADYYEARNSDRRNERDRARSKT
jgi:hypothetical protein